MTSHAPDECCFVVFKHEGEAQGTVEKFGGLQCYLSFPIDGSTKFGIVLFPDFMGYELINVKLIADRFAANGFFTVIPDIWEGDNVPLDFDEDSGSFSLEEWVQKHGPDRVMPIAEATIAAMHENGCQRLGGVGYCLGAKYVSRCMAKGKGIDAGYFAHPSLVTSEEIERIAGPLSIAAAKTDVLFPANKRFETEEILREKEIVYQVNLYSGVEHGFALKADVRKPSTKFATETAFWQAVNWFDHYLKSAMSS